MPDAYCADKCKVAFTSASLLLVALVNFTLMALMIVITASETAPSLMVAGILGSVFVGVAGIVASAVFLFALIGTVMYCANASATHNCITKLLVVFGIFLTALTVPGAVFGILMYCFYQSTPMLRLAVPCLVFGVVLCVVFAFWLVAVLLTCVCMEAKRQYDEVDEEDTDEEDEGADAVCSLFCGCCKKGQGVFKDS